MNRFLTSSVAAAALALGAAGAASAEPVKNVVLVHGAFADGSGWRAVADILQHDGYSVSVVQEPETSLADDAAAPARSPRQSLVRDQRGMTFGGAMKIYVAMYFAPPRVRWPPAGGRRVANTV